MNREPQRLMNSSSILCRLSLAAVLLLACSQTALIAQSQDLKLVAQLIWGTDGGMPAEAKIKEIDRDTRAKLKGIFRWKNYFEVSREEFTVATAAKRRVQMSKKCQVEVENQGRSIIEVKLFGEDKLLLTKRQVLRAGELLVLAGDDKDDTAWFVILTLATK
jgi:hypothetical protein